MPLNSLLSIDRTTKDDNLFCPLSFLSNSVLIRALKKERSSLQLVTNIHRYIFSAMATLGNNSQTKF